MINEQREILNLVNVGNEKEASSDVVSKADSSVVTEESKQGATEKARALVDFKVDAIEVSRASQISVYDESVMPAFEQSIVFNVVKLTRLNSRDKDILASLLLDADIGKHANITMNADIQPFLPKLNLNTKTKLTEFSLPRVSSYMGKSLGLEFLSGQLDSDITLKVVDNILDGDAVINLRGLELAGTSHEKGNLVEETGMVPLNVALNMLKDADDNVELNIPLSGDVNSPSFGIQSFVGLVTKKAIMSATESYLMQTFVPYSNIVSVAKIAGEFMLKVTIDDLIYEPSQLVVSDKQTQFVSDLVALMAEYPKKQLKVCVVSVPEDIGIKNSLGKEEQAELVKFAGERAQLFKEELVTNYQVASARLLLCKPKIETQENASPRIEFRF